MNKLGNPTAYEKTAPVGALSKIVIFPKKMILRPSLAVGILMILLRSLAVAQAGESVTVDRSKLLAESGTVEILKNARELFPLTDKVTRFPITFPGSPSFRLHFRVLSAKSAQTATSGIESKWTIDIVDSQRETIKLWSQSSESSEIEFWSAQIFKSKATIIISTQEVGIPLQITYDRVVKFTPKSKDLTIVANALAPINAQSSEIKSWGRAIAKLTVVRDDNQLSFSCTGFLVSPDLLITNRHCAESGSEARSVSAQFDFDTPGSDPPLEAQVRVKEMVLSSCDLDFTLLRLVKAVPFFPGDDRKPLQMLPSGALSLNHPLLVIQHPGGLTKQVSITGCTLKREQMIGNSSLGTDFGHGCDTNKSSSGSPIQIIGSSADQNGKVIGIHHLGFRFDDVQSDVPEKVNRAVKINLIADFIKSVSPALAKELKIP